MLGELLSMHPDVAYWLEPKYIWRFGNPGAKHDVRSKEEATGSVKNFIRKSFYSFMYTKGKARFAEKTPSNVFRIEFIKEVFPEALFIHLIRDGRDVVLSAEKKWTSRPDRTALVRRLRRMEIPLAECPYYGFSFLRDVFGRIVMPSKGFIWGPQFPGIHKYRSENSVLRSCARQWVESVEACQQAFGSMAKEGVYELRYETFLEAPEAEMRSLLKFLGLSEDCVSDMFADFRSKAPKERSTDELAKLDSVSDLITDKLRQLGYS